MIGEEADSTTLYIKNLNWKTSEENIRKMFGKVEGLKTVVLPKKKGPTGESLPLGFGFVVYENRQQALKALNKWGFPRDDNIDLMRRLWMVMCCNSSSLQERMW